MNKKRTIIAAIVLLLVLLVGGAIAYFTDETDPVTNTFTLGKVSITLTEPNWVTTDSDNNGVPDVAEKLVPGDSLLKNPTVTVDADSNDAFVFVKVEVPCVGSKEVFTYDVTDTKWTVIQNGACSSETGAAVKVYGYSDALEAEKHVTLFESVTLVNLSNEEAQQLAGNIDMPVKAFAIQADNVEGATAAVWNANFSD